MSKAELVTSLAYDMATVTRLKDNLDQLLSLFDVRNQDRRPVQANRIICACIYFGICRLVYRTGLTLGEELVELVPFGNPRLDRVRRLRWFTLTITPYLLLAVLPNRPIIKLIQTLLTDVWFCLTPNPYATTFIEHVLKPEIYRPVCIHPESGLVAPRWLFPTYGIASVLSALKEFVATCRTPKHVRFSVSDEEIATPPPPSCGPPCAICMDPIVASTATICGHVFCWKCIMDWCVSGEHGADGGVPCPTCRTSCKASDLVALVNYAPSGNSVFWRKALVINSNR